MNALDLLFILAALYCPLAGALGGPLREAAAAAGMLLGFILAGLLYPAAAGLLGRWFSDPDYLRLLGFLGVWMAVGSALALAGLIADRMLRPRKGIQRRTGAAALGLVRAVCFAAALLVPLVAFFSENAAVLRQSRFAPHVTRLSAPLSAVAPPALRDGFQTKVRSLRQSWEGAGS
jgi:uncharacterized membrane protein required for colicin V production